MRDTAAHGRRDRLDPRWRVRDTHEVLMPTDARRRWSSSDSSRTAECWLMRADGFTVLRDHTSNPLPRHPTTTAVDTFGDKVIAHLARRLNVATFRGVSAAAVQLQELLDDLNAGRPPGRVERRHVDVKEETGRRSGSTVLPGPADLEDVSRQLLSELACMANTPGGGAIVLGVADNGDRTGATIDGEPLRHRLFELSQRLLTAWVTEEHLTDGTRVLIIEVPPAVEPVRVRGRIRWRVHDNCVDVDAATWFGRMGRPGAEDWSAQATELTTDRVQPSAVATLRRFLDDANRSDVHMDRTDVALLRAISGVVADDVGHLTNAGRLLFTDLPPAIDYFHRPVSGAEASIRVRRSGPLLDQLARVLDAIGVRLSTVSLPVPNSPVVAQHQTLPARAVREAIVNAVVHRDWHSDQPVVVEHVDDRLTVTSPGGFFGTVAADNILTHPSLARHGALARAADAAGIAEQQGVGVDRMYLDLLVIGRPAPIIEELDGPRVRARLYGGSPDVPWFETHRQIEPRSVGQDLRVLIALDMLTRRGFTSASALAPAIQDDVREAEDVMDKLSGGSIGGRPVIARVNGRPPEWEPTWRLARPVRAMLRSRVIANSRASRRTMLADYARSTGRISTTETQDLADVSHGTANTDLKALERDGLIVGATAAGGGRSFHYLPRSDGARERLSE